MNTWLALDISSEQTGISVDVEDIRNILVKGGDLLKKQIFMQKRLLQENSGLANFQLYVSLLKQF